jgi:fucose permease
LVFFWFLIFSIPTGMLMNKIGRKNTVLLSLLITAISLLLPVFGESFGIMLISFSLLGIGNAIMQTSLNPLVSAITNGENLASTLTFGQFVKAIASFMAPFIALWGSTATIPSLGLGWRVLFPLYLIIGIIATLALFGTHIENDVPADKPSTFGQCLKLLGRPIVLLSFIGIICCVGIDVGTNTTAPKVLMERLGFTLNEAAFAASLYFIFRTIGCFTGSFFLRIMSNKAFFAISTIMLVLAMIGLCAGTSRAVLYAAIAMTGYGNSNLFSIIYSQALLSEPDKQNEVSGLMIMGIFGGTIFPLLMGFASDAKGQLGAILVMSIGVLYVLGYTRSIKH